MWVLIDFSTEEFPCHYLGSEVLDPLQTVLVDLLCGKALIGISHNYFDLPESHMLLDINFSNFGYSYTKYNLLYNHAE